MNSDPIFKCKGCIHLECLDRHTVRVCEGYLTAEKARELRENDTKHLKS